jgi:hypothetical protein
VALDFFFGVFRKKKIQKKNLLAGRNQEIPLAYCPACLSLYEVHISCPFPQSAQNYFIVKKKAT